MAHPALFFEPEPVPRLPEPALGPEGPKIGQKPGAGAKVKKHGREEGWEVGGESDPFAIDTATAITKISMAPNSMILFLVW